jgi:hypothetical protein
MPQATQLSTLERAHPLAAVLRGLNDRDQLGKGASQSGMDGTRPQLHAQVLIHAVLQASEELVGILMLPGLRTRTNSQFKYDPNIKRRTLVHSQGA